MQYGVLYAHGVLENGAKVRACLLFKASQAHRDADRATRCATASDMRRRHTRYSNKCNIYISVMSLEFVVVVAGIRRQRAVGSVRSASQSWMQCDGAGALNSRSVGIGAEVSCACA
jgi:hypothetical protein